MKFKNFFKNTVSLILVGAFSASSLLFFDGITAHAAVEPIEPGSSESFWEWSSSTSEYLSEIFTSGMQSWPISTIDYALDINSLVQAYNVWFENQSVFTGQIQWYSWSGVVSLRNVPNTDGGTRQYPAYISAMVTTGVPNGGYPSQFSFGKIGFSGIRDPGSSADGVHFRWASNPFGLSTSSLTGTVLTNFPTSGSFYTVSGMSIYCHNNQAAPASGYSYTDTSTRRSIDLYQPLNIKPNVINFSPDVSLPQQFDAIKQNYPDIELDLLPDLIPPVNDVEWNEQETTEPSTHPDGCNCEVHVHVTVDVNHDDIEFPTYSVSDVPEPSDFDFSPLATINSDDTGQFSFDIQDIPEDALTGASFWFGLMDDLVELFEIKGLVITLLSVSLLLFFILR